MNEVYQAQKVFKPSKRVEYVTIKKVTASAQCRYLDDENRYYDGPADPDYYHNYYIQTHQKRSKFTCPHCDITVSCAKRIAHSKSKRCAKLAELKENIYLNGLDYTWFK